MSTPSRRRNRSLASCEPCRRCKIRCDHRRPVCASCQRRGLHCWYHPAPLTKQRNPQNPTSFSSHASNCVAEGDRSRNIQDDRCSSINPLTSSPIFHTWPFMSADPSDPPLQGQITEPGVYNIKSHDDHLASIGRIISQVSQVRFLPLICNRIDSYYQSSQVPLVPQDIAYQLYMGLHRLRLDPRYLKSWVTVDTNRRASGVSQLAKDILHCSSTEVVTTPGLDVKAFCALFAGKDIRIETIGLLLTMTARSHLYSMMNGGEKNDDENREIIREMGWCGNLALRLSRELSPQPTDVTIWLAHENLQLTTHFEGDSSLAVWRRIGELATDILALGLNKEATYTFLPVFLAELRRRTFAKAYYLDKMFAAVFNRPPRMTARHADCALPLDLSDEEILRSPAEIYQAKSKLTEDGWNTDKKHRTATWVRIRYILAELREETIEYLSRPLQQSDAVKLRDLSSRCHQTWNSLPRHLQYKNECWASDIPPEQCYIHAKVYLSYLHTHFQIYRSVNHHDGSTSFLPELLEVSMKMLETVVQMTNRRSRSFSPLDLPGIVLTCGLPCAAILSTALMDGLQDSSGVNFPPAIKVSNVIRHLSVLISQLETMSSPSEVNHAFCLKASKTISHKLDQILEGMTTVGTTQTSTGIISEEILEDPFKLLDTASTGTMQGGRATDSVVNLDDFNLADWLINFDVGTIFDE